MLLLLCTATIVATIDPKQYSTPALFARDRPDLVPGAAAATGVVVLHPLAFDVAEEHSSYLCIARRNFFGIFARTYVA